jgi:arabinose-5-phosphate isomerase
MNKLSKIQQWGLEVLEKEITTLSQLYQTIESHEFEAACNMLLSCSGKVVVMGIGKSGHIANKVASTLASTGTSSFFVHPSEAAHGDLGMIEAQDHVLILSHSGESSEIIALLPALMQKKIKFISITGYPKSRLAQAADINLHIPVQHEACPLGLAPTASTTAALALGDAIAVSLLSSKGFTQNDFAKSHPGGKLGRKLVLRVSDLMSTADQIPITMENTPILDTLLEMTQKGLGMIAVINKNHQLSGIFTDGDLRRAIQQKINMHHIPINDFMSKNPKCISAHSLATDALEMMQRFRIQGLFITDQNSYPIGALHINHLLQAGIS